MVSQTAEVLKYLDSNPSLGDAQTSDEFAFDRIFNPTAGMGINSLTASARPAYLGSVSAAAPFVHSIVADEEGLFPGVDIVKLLNGPTIAKEVCDSLGPKFKPSFESLSLANIHEQKLAGSGRFNARTTSKN